MCVWDDPCQISVLYSTFHWGLDPDVYTGVKWVVLGCGISRVDSIDAWVNTNDLKSELRVGVHIRCAHTCTLTQPDKYSIYLQPLLLVWLYVHKPFLHSTFTCNQGIEPNSFLIVLLSHLFPVLWSGLFHSMVKKTLHNSQPDLRVDENQKMTSLYNVNLLSLCLSVGQCGLTPVSS